MKNLFLFSLVFLTAFACNKSEEQTVQEQIQGDWLIYSFVVDQCTNPADNFDLTRAYSDGCIDLWGEDICMTISFAANGRGTIIQQYVAEVNETDTQEFSYTVDETSGVIDLCISDEFSDECVEFILRDDILSQVMDEDGCICRFEFIQD